MKVANFMKIFHSCHQNMMKRKKSHKENKQVIPDMKIVAQLYTIDLPPQQNTQLE